MEILKSKNKFTSLTMIDVAKMSAKGQIVIPEDIRRKLSLKKGSKVILHQQGKKLMLISEKDFEVELENQKKEEAGWLIIAEKSLSRNWDSETDDEWGQYL